MNMVIIILLSIIAYQTFCFGIYLLTGGKEKYVLIATLLPFVIISKIYSPIYKKLKFNYYKKYYDGYRFYYKNPNDPKQYSMSKLIFIKKTTAQKLNQDNSKQYYLKKESCGSTWKSLPPKTDVYKNQKVFHGIEMEKNLWV